MPLQFSLWWKLLNPAYAIGLGLMFVAMIALLAYVPALRWPRERRTAYQRRIAFASELLVSVGIIGLVTFAARAKIDAELNQFEYDAQEARRQVNVALWDLTRVYCLRESTEHSEENRQILHEACCVAPDLMQKTDTSVEWFSGREELIRLSQVRAIDDGIARNLATAALAIQRMLAAQNELAYGRQKKKILEAEVSWPLIAFCAVLAGIGVALKWTRTALDLKRFPD
ncbi:MAG TPA: hypothetical protein VF774_20465 [Pseudoduganella sp.]|jgi:hypothetical protein